eukprot:scaffold55491_cov66-Cyclotella_meneghiniana.AAC.6
MKTFYAANALIALMLPSSTAKKDQSSPHRVFQTTRSKATKAQSYDAISSKDGKTFKDLLPKAAKNSKCVESDVDLNDFELMLDFSSMSMSMSMSMPMSKSSKAAKSVKCHKTPIHEEFNDHEHPTEQRFEDDEHFNEHEYPDEERFDDYDDGYWYFDDGYWYYDDDYWYYDDDRWNNDADPTATATSTCAGVLDFDSCAVQAVIGVLSSIGFDDDSMTTRMLRGAKAARKLEDYLTTEEYGCVVPTEEEINEVIDMSLEICEDVTTGQRELVAESFISIFTNETCVCGII